MTSRPLPSLSNAGKTAPSHMSRSDALNLWYGVTLAAVRDAGPDLSARQMAILMTVYLTPAPHTVRSLAAHLGVTKAVITRALDSLGGLGFVARARDPRDKRSVLVQRTGRGSSYLTEFADSVRDHAKAAQHRSSASTPTPSSAPRPDSRTATRTPVQAISETEAA